MPTLKARAWADMVIFAIKAKDGATLASHFSYEDPHAKSIFTSLDSSGGAYGSNNHNDGRPAYVRDLDSSFGAGRGAGLPKVWPEMLAHHVAAIIYFHDRNQFGENEPDWEGATTEQMQICKIFQNHLRQSREPTGWTLPVIYTLCRQLRSMSIRADTARVARGEKAGRLEETSRLLTSYFSICVQDRGGALEESKRLGSYYLACLLFKTYFKLQTLTLCRNIRRGIDNTDLPSFESFPMAHRVTYSYYLGVIAFLNEQYDVAERELLSAFLNCHRKNPRNGELILTYLIPIRLMRGVLPSALLLSAFNRLKVVYDPFVAAFRRGDVKKYDEALAWAEKRLLENGTYLAVESAREGCLKGLLRRVYKMMPEASRTRIPVETFRKALATAGVAADLEEVECILANMIHKGHMKGYISHEKSMVVLSAKDAFPKLSTTMPT